MASDRKSLIAAAKELNDLLELDPKIKVVAVKTEELETKIKETAKLFEEGDEISAETKAVFDGLEVTLPEFVKVLDPVDPPKDEEEKKEPKKEEPKKEEPNAEEAPEVTIEALTELATEMNTIMGLEPEIKVDLPFDELKEEVTKNCYDDGEVQIFDTDDFSEGALATLKSLGIEPVVTVVKPNAEKDDKKDKSDKKEGGKGGKGGSTKKKDGEGKTTAKAPKAPGVIATIIETIKTKGPIKKADILEELKKAFPDREEKSMKATINVQVPGRINKERDFKVVDNGNGWVIDKKK